MLGKQTEKRDDDHSGPCKDDHCWVCKQGASITEQRESLAFISGHPVMKRSKVHTLKEYWLVFSYPHSSANYFSLWMRLNLFLLPVNRVGKVGTYIKNIQRIAWTMDFSILFKPFESAIIPTVLELFSSFWGKFLSRTLNKSFGY